MTDKQERFVDRAPGSGRGMTRKRLLIAGAGLGAAALVPAGIAVLGDGDKQDKGGSDVGSGTPSNTLVMAAADSPNGFDDVANTSDGTRDVCQSCMASLLTWKLVEDTEFPDVRREDLSYQESERYGWALEGALAEKWSIEDGGRRAVFTLKQGVKSNHGNELTAEDVKWSWDRRFALKQIGSFFTGVLSLESPDAIKVEGKYVVSFRTAKPQPLWLPIMTSWELPVHDSTFLKESGDEWGKKFMATQIAGFGPYEVTQFSRGQQVTLKARGDYHGPKPALASIVRRQIPSGATRAALLSRGDVDIATALTARDLKSLQSKSGVDVRHVKSNFMSFIAMNCAAKPFSDVQVRQAMNYAFPHEDVLESVYLGYAAPLKSGNAEFYAGSTTRYFDYATDLEKAKALLAEAGLGKGFSTTLSYLAADAVQEQIAILYQTSLAKIGVKVKLNSLPDSAYAEARAGKKEPMLLLLDASLCPDPGYATYLYFKGDSFVNFANYRNATVDELLDRAAVMADLGDRIPIYEEIQKHYMADAPWVFVAAPDFSVALRSNVKGFTYRAADAMAFQDLRKV